MMIIKNNNSAIIKIAIILVELLGDRSKKGFLAQMAFQVIALCFELLGLMLLFGVVRLILMSDVDRVAIINKLSDFLPLDGGSFELMHLMGLVSGFYLLSGILRIIAQRGQFKFGMDVERAIGKRLYSKYLSNRYSWHKDNHSSKIAKSLLQDSSQVVSGLVLPIMALLSNILLVLGVFLLGGIFNPFGTFSVIAMLTIFFLTANLFMKSRIAQLSVLKENAAKQRYKFVAESMSNVAELYITARKSDEIVLNWHNYNRVPNPGSWFTDKSRAWGGVSRDLLPHLLSWVQVFDPEYNDLSLYSSGCHQHYTLDTVGSTDYGVVDPSGVYDVDDSVELLLNSNWHMYTCTASWKNPVGDKINIEFFKQGDLIHTEPLGLCPEDAYEKMVDTAVDNLYNDRYWSEQFARDVWIHKQLELF